jgi:hypothetical protein
MFIAKEKMANILIEVQGEAAVAATEALLATPGLEGTWETEAGTEREAALVTIATIVGIVGGAVAIAEQIRKWYQEYREGKSNQKIEKVVIMSRSGRRLVLMENVTVEQIQQLLED